MSETPTGDKSRPTELIMEFDEVTVSVDLGPLSNRQGEFRLSLRMDPKKAREFAGQLILASESGSNVVVWDFAGRGWIIDPAVQAKA